MRPIIVLTALAAACSTAPGGISPVASCQSDYDRCVRREPDAAQCEDYRAACVAQGEAVREAAGEKQRSYEEFLEEREEAGE